MTPVYRLLTLTALTASALLLGAALDAGAHPRKSLDTNGDGSVDLAEIQAAKPDFTVEKFNKADANGDGLLSREELRAAHGQARFARLDTDGNGSVSLAELQAAKPGMTAERFGEIDANGDGQATPEELRAAHQERMRHHGERGQHKPDES